MSRVGKQPVTIVQGVEVSIDGNNVKAKGSKGELQVTFEENLVKVSLDEGQVIVERLNDSKTARSRHGLYRSLIENIIMGVSQGFSKSLEIKGVGYRAALKGKVLEMNLGFSHPVNFDVPEGIDITFDEKNNNLFTVSGIDKQLVGQTAADIREFRKPEPYKGKGIRYTDEYVLRKPGKAAAAK